MVSTLERAVGVLASGPDREDAGLDRPHASRQATWAALIEMADRCGLAVDLIDAVSAQASTHLSTELAAGIRRIEGLLFPYARTACRAAQQPMNRTASRKGGPMTS